MNKKRTRHEILILLDEGYLTIQQAEAELDGLVDVWKINDIIRDIDYENFGKLKMTHGKLHELQAKAIVAYIRSL